MIDNAAIDFYGADWCGDCHRAKAALDRFGVAYSLMISSMRMVLQRRPLRSADNSTFP